MSDHHESPIKTPKDLITVVILAFVIPIALIGFLVAYVTGGKHGDVPATAKPESVAERIKPVAAVTVRDANAPKVLQSGEQVYKAICAACHDTGAANAPKLGDAAGWAARIKMGGEDLIKSAIKGKGGMPAKGGNPDLDDVEVGRAVVFLANASGASFKEPAVAAAAPAASGGAPAATADAKPAAAAAPAATAAALPAKVLFAVGKAGFDDEGKKAVDAAAAYLKANASAKVSISGYVDSTGNAAQNAELAKQRAFAVRDALKAGGVAEDRIALKKPEEIKGGGSADARRVEINLAK